MSRLLRHSVEGDNIVPSSFLLEMLLHVVSDKAFIEHVFSSANTIVLYRRHLDKNITGGSYFILFHQTMRKKTPTWRQ